MMNIQKDRMIAFLLSAVITIAIIGIIAIIIGQDTASNWLKKSIFAVILFFLLSIVFYFMFSSEKAKKALKADNLWFWSLILVVTTFILIIGDIFVYIFHYIIS